MSAYAKGIAYVVLGCMLLTLSDAVMKWLSASHPVSQLLCARGAVLLMVLAPVLLLRRGRRRALPVSNVRGHVLRGVLSIGSAFLFLTGLSFLPLAETVTLAFAGPLFLTAMAPCLLGESVGWRRWLAVGVGFAGVVIMLKPGSEALRLVALLPLGAALAEALRDALTRHLRFTESALSMMVTSNAMIVAFSAVFSTTRWPQFEYHSLALLALTATLFAVAHFLLIESLRLIEAAVIAPFRYSSVLWALLLGVVFWNQLPDRWVVVGAALVTSSGLFIWYREWVRSRTVMGSR